MNLSGLSVLIAMVVIELFHSGAGKCGKGLIVIFLPLSVCDYKLHKYTHTCEIEYSRSVIS